MVRSFTISGHRRGLFEITSRVEEVLADSGVDQGLCTVFIRHTSASLVIQENADPSARADLENCMDRLVPENDPIYTHTHEGPDDMPAHVKSALTCTSIGIPVDQSRLCLGTWQGIYLWEHRSAPGTRTIVVSITT